MSGSASATAEKARTSSPRSEAIDRKTPPPSTWATPNRAATKGATVLVPEPGGPEIVTSTRCGQPRLFSPAGSAGKRREQLAALLVTEAAHAASLADAHFLHSAASLHLADTGEGFEHGENLHLCNDFLRVRQAEKLLEVDRAHLELLLELCAFAPGSSRLVERRLSLLS